MRIWSGVSEWGLGLGYSAICFQLPNCIQRACLAKAPESRPWSTPSSSHPTSNVQTLPPNQQPAAQPFAPGIPAVDRYLDDRLLSVVRHVVAVRRGYLLRTDARAERDGR